MMRHGLFSPRLYLVAALISTLSFVCGATLRASAKSSYEEAVENSASLLISEKYALGTMSALGGTSLRFSIARLRWPDVGRDAMWLLVERSPSNLSESWTTAYIADAELISLRNSLEQLIRTGEAMANATVEDVSVTYRAKDGFIVGFFQTQRDQRYFVSVGGKAVLLQGVRDLTTMLNNVSKAMERMEALRAGR